MTISKSQLFFLKYSLLIESIVLPIPFSSFKVGRMTLIFRLNHSRKNIYKRIKRVLKKNKKKRRESYLS